LHRYDEFPARQRLLGGLALLLLLLACGKDPSPVAAAATTRCVTGGRLATEIYGGIRASLDWQSGDLHCEGMPRPNGAGARLRFSGPASPAEAGRHLAFIFGLPDLQRGQTGDEMPTNVTVIEEDAGRFFSSRDTTTCWTDIDRQDTVQAGGDDASSDDYLISGVLYCVAPLAELHGNASLRIADLRFVGRLNWRVPQ